MYESMFDLEISQLKMFTDKSSTNTGTVYEEDFCQNLYFFVMVIFITYTDKKWRSTLKVNLGNGNISKPQFKSQ